MVEIILVDEGVLRHKKTFSACLSQGLKSSAEKVEEKDSAVKSNNGSESCQNKIIKKRICEGWARIGEKKNGIVERIDEK